MKCCEWKPGASLCFERRFDADFFRDMKAAGLECAELSFSQKDYYEKLNFLENAPKIAADAEAAGIELWSIHLPFSGLLDISQGDAEKREFTIKTHKELMAAAAKAGVKVAVVHPSAEPIADDDRPARLAMSKQKLTELAAYAKALGMRLAVENLPRTCLIRNSDEALYMFENNPDLFMVFDTNHCLMQDNTEFVNIVGEHIISLHVSDYDFIDERHVLPFDGKNDWKSIITALENKGYTGPWMYEVGSGNGRYTLKGLYENYRRLAAL